jgi:hypothetical protein
MDNTAIQQMSWAYLLYPSLLLSVCLLLPIAAVTNWLRRNYQFDAPWAAEPGAATLQQKARDFQQQQAAKQAAVVRQWRALELDRGGSQQSLHQELHSPLAKLGRLLQPILQLLSFPRHPQQQQPQRWGYITTSTGERLQVRGISLDLGPGLNLGQSITDAGSAEAAAAAALEDAIRQRLIRQEQDRQYEDKLHRRRMWGGSEQTPDLRKFSERLEDLHQQRMQESSDVKGPVLPPVGWNQQLPGLGDQQQQQQQQQQPVGWNQQQQLNGEGNEDEVPLVSPRQRLEQHWEQGAELASSSKSSSRLGLRSSSPNEQQQQQQGDDEKQ